MITPVLLDLRSPDSDWNAAEKAIATADLLGLDCETQDEGRHAGLRAFNKGKKHAFDVRRIEMTGFSFYADGDDRAYYLNLGHADVENRVPPDIARALLSRRKPGSMWLAHNAPFELMAFGQTLGVELPDLICTLQMAVSSHGPDEFTPEAFYQAGLYGLKKLVPDILAAFAHFDPEKHNHRSLTPDMQLVMGQFTAKESKAQHSYNGFVKDIGLGYGLKKLVKSFFDFEMETYEQLLARFGAKHMGELTGEQTVRYGADDGYWAVRVYHKLYAKMLAENPAALVTFFEGEAPMAQQFARAWVGGLRLNTAEVHEKRAQERARAAALLRTLKAQIAALLPFSDDLSPILLKHQPWYAKSGQKKRDQITAWATSPDSDDDFEQCFQLSNPVGNAWAEERGIKVPDGKLNLNHYYGMRTLLHDLMGHRLVRIGGDITTDKEARARMRISFEEAGEMEKVDVLASIDTFATIEQTMKLYLTPYTNLMDPETGRVYPNITSMLATRRMAMSNPNGMQLAKRGEATFVRGFFEADADDEIIVSADWSSVELVLIGEESGDPEFAEVFSTTPYGDLHSGASADCLAVSDAFKGLTLEEFQCFKAGENPNNRRLTNFRGEEIAPKAFHKLMRTEVGKGANFNYWYSGALGTVGERLGWTTEEMWAAVDRYRQRFAVAEQWRLRTIEDVKNYGYVTLPDGHRRVRAEATDWWRAEMIRKFMRLDASPAMQHYADVAVRRISGRAGNQAVNAKIQGMCARLAKDSIINLERIADTKGFRFRGWTDAEVRFLMPIHDELLYSVKREYVAEFIPLLRQAMCNHPRYVNKLHLLVNVAIGRTFKPYDPANPAFSQIELDEAPVIEGLIPKEYAGQPLPPELIDAVIHFVGEARAA